MKFKNKLNVVVLSDFENFNKNINKIFAPLPIKNINFSFVDSINSIKGIVDADFDLLIINKAAYTEDEIKDLLKYDYKTMGVIVIVDTYFKFDMLFKNVDSGIITIRRPITVNKFIEVLKVCLLSDERKKNPDNKLIDIRIMDFAKVLLIIYKKLSEDEAHKYIEKYAMELRIQIYRAAGNIISYYLNEMENIKYEYKY